MRAGLPGGALSVPDLAALLIKHSMDYLHADAGVL